MGRERKITFFCSNGVKRVKVSKPRAFLPLLVDKAVGHLQRQRGVQDIGELPTLVLALSKIFCVKKQVYP